MEAGRQPIPLLPWRLFAGLALLAVFSLGLAGLVISYLEQGRHGVEWLQLAGIALAVLGLGALLFRRIWRQQELRGRNALARQLVDLAAAVPGALVTFRQAPDGAISIVYASSAIEELCGLAPAQLADDASAFSALVHPADREHFHAAIAESARTLSLWHAEFRILHPRKGQIWIEGRSAPRREPDGAILWHGFIHDISQRRSAEAALRQATERWRHLAEAMPQLVWICDATGKGQYFNRHWQEYTGQVGQAWLETLHAEDQPRLTRVLDQATPDGNAFEGEFRLRRADGAYRWFKTHAVPIRDEAGILTGWYGFNTDIQAIKEVELSLQRSLLRQQALQKLDRAILESSTPEETAAKGLAHLATLLPCWSTAAMTIDLDAGEGIILAAHNRHESLGYVQGLHVSLADYGTADLAILRTGQIRTIPDLAALPSRPALLESLYRQGMRSCVRIPLMAEGRLVGALGLGSEETGYFGKAEMESALPVADVLAIALQQSLLRHRLLQQTATLEMRIQERTAELERLKDEAEAACRAKSQFLANMSSELKTPLNSLLILSELLADNAQDNLTPEQREFAQVIHHAGNDLLALINDILDISKLETGRAAVHCGDLGFVTILGHIDRIFRRSAEEKGLALDLELAAGLPAFIHTDFDHLEPILRNLVANAIKFTTAGSVLLRAYPAQAGWSAGHPVLAEAKTVVAFEVVDTGIGIAADQQANLFDPLPPVGIDMTRRYGGTGLGLHIARSNAELLGGELTVASTPGQGSTFTLYLPQIYVGPGSVAKKRGAPALLPMA
ncbi:MAG: response regulator [Rhodocyclaceae bacterium]|nr:response regulator [Rhodocyclaceae bacterium]